MRTAEVVGKGISCLFPIIATLSGAYVFLRTSGQIGSLPPELQWVDTLATITVCVGFTTALAPATIRFISGR